MRTLLAASLLCAVSVFVARATLAGDPPAAPAAPAQPAPVVKLMNDHCPVTGEEINPELSHEWNGLEIRFCCEGCIPGFLADPAKYMPTLLKDLMAQRDAAIKKCSSAPRTPAAPTVATAPPPPVPAVPAPAAPAVPAGTAPLVPTAPAIPAEPARVEPTAVAAPALVDLGNAMCPISTRPVKAGIFVEYHGMNVRLCCKGCVGGFNADPAKSLTWLRQDPVVARRIDAAEAAWAAKSAGPAPSPVPSPVK